MNTWLERFLISVLATILAATVLTNPWQLDRVHQTLLIVAIVAISIVASRTIERSRGAKTNSEAVSFSSIASEPADGQGGRGGGGNAIGKGSAVIGGYGGAGGGPGGGRGGDGGGGDAVGEGSRVIGGDGGGGGRSDGRGGRGGDSPLKRVSPDLLKSFGLTGTEGYGQGGSGESSSDYVRRLKILNTLSAEYLSANPKGHMEPMHGVLMPPVAWVNSRLSENGEPFQVELIDNGTDFLFRSICEDERLDD